MVVWSLMSDVEQHARILRSGLELSWFGESSGDRFLWLSPGKPLLTGTSFAQIHFGELDARLHC